MFEDLLKQAPGSNVSEQDFRLNILNALLQTPHRNIEPFVPLFRHVAQTDPLFFAHLAAWHARHGTVRDLNQLFAAFLCISPFSPEHREAGLALTSNMPPYMVERVYRILKGREVNNQFVSGIGTGVPRSFRTAVSLYLREREADQKFFDSAVMQARKSIRTLYASLRIKPSAYAQGILFDGKAPEGSTADAIKKIANSKTPAEQAKLIIENKIPYKVASTIISEMTPTVLLALVSAMTPAEVINNLASLKNRGALDNEEISKIVNEKVSKASTDKRVSALKTRQALAASGVSGDLAEKVTKAGDARLKSGGLRIKKSTALLVDKSGSLKIGIDVGKSLASVIAPVCEKLTVMAFDTMSYPINPKATNLSDWEAAFKGIIANGGTSCGSPIKKLLKDGNFVEQIIMVTDQDETTPPYMVDSLTEFSKARGEKPNVVILNVGTHCDTLERKLRAAGFEVDTFTFKGDYYSLPTIIPMLAGGSRLDLLSDIMDFPLPKRELEKELATV